MPLRLLQESISWRLNTFILLIVLLMTALSGAVYYFKTQDEGEYERLLRNLEIVNNSSAQVQDIVGLIMVYRSTPTENLAENITTSIDEVQENFDEVHARTAAEHEQSVYTAQGLQEISINLEHIFLRVADQVKQGQVTIELLDDLDLLNIMIDIVQRNTSRYVISELTYAGETRQAISNRNMRLGALLLMFLLFSILLVILFVVIIQKSIVHPILRLESTLTEYRKNGHYEEVPTHGMDELGSLTTAVNDMVETVRQREQALAVSEVKYRNLYDKAPIMLGSVDLSGKIIEVNDAWLKTLGYLKHEVIGLVFLNYFDKASAKRLKSRLPGLYRDGQLDDIELQLVTKHGETRDVHLTAHLERDEQGEPRSIRAACVDISEQNRMQAEKDTLELQLIQSQKLESIGRLAGGVAHDLNNLLAPILGYSELLLSETSLSARQRDDVNEICTAGASAKEIVGQLLAFSRKQALRMESVDINKTLQGYENLLKRTLREDIVIKMVLAPGIRPVRADQGQIQQVIMNLSVNAAQAMPEGGTLTIETQEIHIDAPSMEKHPEVTMGDYVVMTFTDSGIGMDEATCKQVFEPFFSTKGEMGTGLGLSTVYGIIKQHKGEITVYSEPGGGTVFTIYLPLAHEIPDEQDSDSAGKVSPSGNETILLAEDNKQVRDITTKILVRLGYTVLSAENGMQALRISRNTDAPIHLLLTDVIMPGMNGKELSEHVQKERPGVKVIYMSGYTDDVIGDHGMLDDGVIFVKKPFTRREIAELLHRILNE